MNKRGVNDSIEPGHHLQGGSRASRAPIPSTQPTQEEQYETLLRDVNLMDKDAYKKWLKVPGNIDLLGAATNWNKSRQATQGKKQ
jgi:hypothetical protein